MEGNCHEVRSDEFLPRGITCLAFEDVENNPKLAVAREDGDIEIWNVRFRAFFIHKVLPRYENKITTKLVWCRNRLISVGLGGDVIEWNDLRLTPSQVVESHGGPVWCAAVSHSRETLALACDDGAPRLFDLSSGNLAFRRALRKQDGRVLCVAWTHEDLILATGCSNGTICLYNAHDGHITTRMTCGVNEKSSVAVWTIMVTKDMLLVSGNSIGQTQFWDINTGTLCQTFKSHHADVLTVAVDPEENTVFSSGVDSKVVQFTRNKENVDYLDWRQTSKLRFTDYDVRCLVTFPKKAQLLSGGVEPRLLMCQYSTKTMYRPSRLPFSPMSRACKLSSETGLLLQAQRSLLQLLALPNEAQRNKTGRVVPHKLLELTTEGDRPVIFTDISDDGHFFAFSHLNELCCYKIDVQNKSDRRCRVKVQKLKVSQPLCEIYSLMFSGPFLIAASEDGIRKITLDADDSKTLDFVSVDELQGICLPCRIVSCSQDGDLIALIGSKRGLYVLKLQAQPELIKIPALPCTPTAVALQASTKFLFWVCAAKHLHIYSLKKERFLKWSIQACSLHILKSILSPTAVFTRLFFDPNNPSHLFLMSETGLVKVDLSKDLPKGKIPKERRQKYMRKHRLSRRKVFITNTGEEVVKVVIQNEGMRLIFADFCKNGELVVVDAALRQIFSALPPPLHVKQFGF